MKNQLIFFARQHAERDIVLPFLSVCPSVRPSRFGVVSKRMHISSDLSDLLVGASP